MSVRFEEVQSPGCEQFRRATRRMYSGGTVRASPSGCVLPSRYREFAERIRALEVRADDVWVISYPKCGTTWTQEMVWLLMHGLDFEGAKQSLSERSPFLEFGAVSIPEEEEGLDQEAIDTIDLTDKHPSPRCIKTHLPKDLLPVQLWTKKPKVIYVTRSANDVVASYYSHHRLCNGYTGTMEEFAEAFMAENIVYWDPFWKHNLDFWKLREEPHVLINTFQDMKKDLPAVIRRTAAFLGKSYTHEQVDLLARHLHFSNMKDNPAVNGKDEVDALHKHFAVNTQFLRRGEVGSGKQELGPDLAARIDSWSEERYRGSGYPWIE